jgi:PleD family two-component response regulator
MNDTHWHHGCDLVIRGFVDRLQLMARKIALFGRIGGKELAVFMPNTTA